MKRDKIIYWIVTGIACLMFFGGGMMYFLNYQHAEGFFISLGFPLWIIYPLAVLKILGALVIISRRFNFLKELAYAGFLYDALLALVAHLMVNDGEHMPAVISLVLLTISWIYDRKVFGKYIQTI